MLKSTFKSINVMFRASPFATVCKLLLVVVTAACEPLSLYFMQRLVDSITTVLGGAGGVNSIVLWIILLVVATMLLDNINYLASVQGITLQRDLKGYMSAQVMEKYRSIHYSCFENPADRDVLDRMGSEPYLRMYKLFQGATDLIGASIIAVGLALIIAQVSVPFAAALVVVYILILVFQFRSVEVEFNLHFQQTAEERKVHYLEGLLSNKRSLFELRMFQARDYVRLLWEEKSARLLKERISTAIKAQRYTAVSNVCVVLWIAAIAALLVSSLFEGAITLGIFVSLLGSIKSISGTRAILEWAFWNIASSHLEMSYYERFLRFPESERKEERDGQENRPARYIEFENVSFKYPGTDTVVLDEVSFGISVDEKVALVGRNGAGKSTIVKLLCGLYEPDAGVIRIDGMPLGAIPQSDIGKCLSFVFQDYAQYQLTLRENVALGSIDRMHDDEAIIRALDDSGFVHTDIRLDDQLGRIEKDGTELSGGQWQRLALARALVSNRRFFVLDEPTASLDPIAESEMYSSFLSTMQGRGSLVISHRLASARLCDRVIVLDEARVVEEGSHTELMARGGLYQAMFDKQSSWYVKKTAANEQGSSS